MPDREAYHDQDVARARDMLAMRVAIGSASWSERLRYWLRLGPPEWLIETSRQRRQFMERMEELARAVYSR